MNPITRHTVVITTDANDLAEAGLEMLLRNLGLPNSVVEIGVGAELAHHYTNALSDVLFVAARASGYDVRSFNDTLYSEQYPKFLAALGDEAIDIEDTTLDIDAIYRLVGDCVAAWWTGPTSPNGDLWADGGDRIGVATREQRDASLAAGYSGVIEVDTRRVFVR